MENRPREFSNGSNCASGSNRTLRRRFIGCAFNTEGVEKQLATEAKGVDASRCRRDLNNHGIPKRKQRIRNTFRTFAS
jgi:hypothetical protein